MRPACAMALGLLTPAAACATTWGIRPMPSVAKVPRTGMIAQAYEEEACVSLAGGEREAVQVVVQTPEYPLTDVRLYVSDLVGETGVIPRTRIALNLVHYIHLPALDRWAPDALPPYEPFDVPALTNQPVWVTISVPAGQAPGIYRGRIIVRPARGGYRDDRRLPLTVRVYDFSLPQTPFGRTAFGIYTEGIVNQHGVQRDSPEFQRLHRAYYEFLLDHLISPYHIPVDLRSPEAEAYFEDPRMTSYVIPYTEDEARLKETTDFLRDRDWLDKGYFYPLDEPITREAYDRGITIWSQIKRVAPDARIVAPFYRGPDFSATETIFDIASDYLNIWCINTGYLNQHGIPAQMYHRQKAGDELWWYVACGPRAPFANFLIPQDAIDHRILFWQQKRYGFTGLLYWSTTYWSPANGTADPWQDMATVKDIDPGIYGDGSLLYPGAKAGVDGPVSSVRLELIRDGVEDYQYLSMLQRCAGLEVAQALAELVAPTLTEYTKSPEQLLDIRDRIARRIEETGMWR